MTRHLVEPSHRHVLVLSMRDLLQRQHSIDDIHRDAGTVAELDHDVGEWLQKQYDRSRRDEWLQKQYDRFGPPIGASRGEPVAIEVGRSHVTRSASTRMPANRRHHGDAAEAGRSRSGWPPGLVRPDSPEGE